ncbi:MAG: DUF2384 domain-containing protein [Gammaproteobacteria bacterium]|nr:MAG: DUF2384 domain-containing protein [Gammaproteobacteria bacterium]
MQNSTQEDHNIELTQAVMYALDSWKFDGEQILSVMALPDDVKVRHLAQYRNSRAFPDTPEVTERLRHVLGIIDALSTSYPTNPQMSLFWMTRSSKKFQNRAPAQVIVEEGLEGLITIRKHLDCSYDWFGDTN